MGWGRRRHTRVELMLCFKRVRRVLMPICAHCQLVECSRGVQSAYIRREDLSNILPLGGIRVAVRGGRGWDWWEVIVSIHDRRAWGFGVVCTKAGVGNSGHGCDMKGVVRERVCLEGPEVGEAEGRRRLKGLAVVTLKKSER